LSSFANDFVVKILKLSIFRVLYYLPAELVLQLLLSDLAIIG